MVASLQRVRALVESGRAEAGDQRQGAESA